MEKLPFDFDNENKTLNEVLKSFQGDPPQAVPWQIRLLENPASPIALPGSVDLKNHDCIHVILNQDLSLESEAVVLGFTMGNDLAAGPFHKNIYKFLSNRFYPKGWAFHKGQLEIFEKAYLLGKSMKRKNIHLCNFDEFGETTVGEIRQIWGLSLSDLPYLPQMPKAA